MFCKYRGRDGRRHVAGCRCVYAAGAYAGSVRGRRNERGRRRKEGRPDVLQGGSSCGCEGRRVQAGKSYCDCESKESVNFIETGSLAEDGSDTGQGIDEGETKYRMVANRSLWRRADSRRKSDSTEVTRVRRDIWCVSFR